MSAPALGARRLRPRTDPAAGPAHRPPRWSAPTLGLRDAWAWRRASPRRAARRSAPRAIVRSRELGRRDRDAAGGQIPGEAARHVHHRPGKLTAARSGRRPLPSPPDQIGPTAGGRPGAGTSPVFSGAQNSDPLAAPREPCSRHRLLPENSDLQGMGNTNARRWPTLLASIPAGHSTSGAEGGIKQRGDWRARETKLGIGARRAS
jgi:hypothetical protein